MAAAARAQTLAGPCGPARQLDGQLPSCVRQAAGAHASWDTTSGSTATEARTVEQAAAAALLASSPARAPRDCLVGVRPAPGMPCTRTCAARLWRLPSWLPQEWTAASEAAQRRLAERAELVAGAVAALAVAGSSSGTADSHTTPGAGSLVTAGRLVAEQMAGLQGFMEAEAGARRTAFDDALAVRAHSCARRVRGPSQQAPAPSACLVACGRDGASGVGWNHQWCASQAYSLAWLRVHPPRFAGPAGAGASATPRVIFVVAGGGRRPAEPHQALIQAARRRRHEQLRQGCADAKCWPRRYCGGVPSA